MSTTKRSSSLENSNVEYMRSVQKMQTFRKVESESGLISSQVIDVEDQLFREIFLATPHHPSNSWVYQPILVATHVDTFHQRKAEIPHKMWIQEGSYKASTCGVYVNWDVPAEMIARGRKG